MPDRILGWSVHWIVQNIGQINPRVSDFRLNAKCMILLRKHDIFTTRRIASPIKLLVQEMPKNHSNGSLISLGFSSQGWRPTNRSSTWILKTKSFMPYGTRHRSETGPQAESEFVRDHCCCFCSIMQTRSPYYVPCTSHSCILESDLLVPVCAQSKAYRRMRTRHHLIVMVQTNPLPTTQVSYQSAQLLDLWWYLWLCFLLTRLVVITIVMFCIFMLEWSTLTLSLSRYSVSNKIKKRTKYQQNSHEQHHQNNTIKNIRSLGLATSKVFQVSHRRAEPPPEKTPPQGPHLTNNWSKIWSVAIHVNIIELWWANLFLQWTISWYFVSIMNL